MFVFAFPLTLLLALVGMLNECKYSFVFLLGSAELLP